MYGRQKLIKCSAFIFLVDYSEMRIGRCPGRFQGIQELVAHSGGQLSNTSWCWSFILFHFPSPFFLAPGDNGSK